MSCPYLQGHLACIEYAEILSMQPGEYEPALLAGWFKFGPYLQRPACLWCRKCTSMRVPLPDWQPNRAHRRILKRNADLEVRISPLPSFSQEKLDLHNRYREAQVRKHGWTESYYDEASYTATFITCQLPMTEISVWQGEQLLSVLMADVDPPILSAVTHFYEPTLTDRSIGLFTILQAFLYGKSLGYQRIYLGYFVPGSPTMDYKKQFHPHELHQWDGEWNSSAEAL
jgi:leucyl-tRNA---protein transferase